MPTAPRRASKGINHASARKAQQRRRGTNKERGYGSDWRAISRMVRQERPVCEVCGAAASTEVDHIKPFDGPDDPLRTDWTNLQAICSECHKRKHHA